MSLSPDQRPDPPPVQFGLKTVFNVVTAFAAAFGVILWLGVLGFLLVLFVSLVIAFATNPQWHGTGGMILLFGLPAMSTGRRRATCPPVL